MESRQAIPLRIEDYDIYNENLTYEKAAVELKDQPQGSCGFGPGTTYWYEAYYFDGKDTVLLYLPKFNTNDVTISEEALKELITSDQRARVVTTKAIDKISEDELFGLIMDKLEKLAKHQAEREVKREVKSVTVTPPQVEVKTQRKNRRQANRHHTKVKHDGNGRVQETTVFDFPTPFGSRSSTPPLSLFAGDEKRGNGPSHFLPSMSTMTPVAHHNPPAAPIIGPQDTPLDDISPLLRPHVLERKIEGIPSIPLPPPLSRTLSLHEALTSMSSMSSMSSPNLIDEALTLSESHSHLSNELYEDPRPSASPAMPPLDLIAVAQHERPAIPVHNGEEDDDLALAFAELDLAARGERPFAEWGENGDPSSMMIESEEKDPSKMIESEDKNHEDDENAEMIDVSSSSPQRGVSAPFFSLFSPDPPAFMRPGYNPVDEVMKALSSWVPGK